MDSKATAAEPLLSLRNVGVSYWLKDGALRRRKHYALKDVSFDLYRGDSLGVVGRNGSGKTTLLMLLAGIMAPDYGEIVGTDRIRASLLTLQLGFIEYLTGRENAILSGLFLGMEKKEIVARMDDIIEFAELGQFMDQPISAYSSGMRARLGFAVAFQLDPDLLLIDEITGVGDVEFRHKSFRMMKERVKCENSTVVFVSHTASQVKALCNRAIWIDEGVVKQAGDVEAVVRTYEKSFTHRDRDRVNALLEKGIPVFVRREGSKAIFAISEGTMKPVGGRDNFLQMGGRFNDIRVLSTPVFNELKAKYSLSEGDIPTFLRKQGEKTIYVLRKDGMEPVGGKENFLKMGGRYDNIKVVSESTFELLKKGLR